MDEQMAAWMKYASPAEEHEFLKKLSGNWTATVKMWMNPDDPPQESTGTATNELIMDGRFLQCRFEGKTPWGDFSGMAIDGFNRIDKKYQGIWMDSMGTIMMVFEGEADGNIRNVDEWRMLLKHGQAGVGAHEKRPNPNSQEWRCDSNCRCHRIGALGSSRVDARNPTGQCFKLVE